MDFINPNTEEFRKISAAFKAAGIAIQQEFTKMAIKINKGSAVSSKAVLDKGKTISETTDNEVVAAPVQKKGGEPVAQAPAASTQKAEVGLEASFTKNLGNYQSSKVGVSLRIPCDVAEIDEVFEYAQKWVDAKMQTLLSDEDGE